MDHAVSDRIHLENLIPSVTSLKQLSACICIQIVLTYTYVCKIITGAIVYVCDYQYKDNLNVCKCYKARTFQEGRKMQILIDQRNVFALATARHCKDAALL